MRLQDIHVGGRCRVGRQDFIRVESGGVVNDGSFPDEVEVVEGLYLRGHVLLVDVESGLLYRKKAYTPCAAVPPRRSLPTNSK